MTTTKKITLATVKSFINKNRKNLHISFRSHFDGSIDGTRYSDNTKFKPVIHADESYTLGILGAYFVGHSRDYFHAYDDDAFVGIEVSNSCANFILAIAKELK